MVEATQQDRDAFAGVYDANAPKYAAEIREGEHDAMPLLQAFAKRAEQAEAQTVAEIVAWLRGQAKVNFGKSSKSRTSALVSALQFEFANAIEQRAFK